MAFCAPSQSLLGQRVSVNGRFASVLFVGRVPPTKGEWLGVAWDDPSAGKHDGTHTDSGTRYFVAGGPTAGSFIRQKKLDPTLSLVDAIKSTQRADDGGEWGSLTELTDAVLRDLPVGGDAGGLGEAAPALEAIDVSHTLISGWGALVRIANELPKLAKLVADENVMHKLPIEGVGSDVKPLGWSLHHAGAFNNLTVLSLNGSRVPVVDVQAICRETPALRELRLCDSGIARLDPSGALRLIAPNFVTQPLRLPKTLTVLNLEGNELEGWASLFAVGHLPALKTVVVRGNRLKRVTAAREGTFLALEMIDLSNNEVSSLDSVGALASYPALTAVNVAGNPLFDEPDEVDELGTDAAQTRQLAIAQMPRLQALDGVAVDAEERVAAERFFVEHNAAAFWEAKDAEGGSSQIPELQRLAALHGEPDRPPPLPSAVALTA